MVKPTLFRKLFPNFLILSLTGFLALLALGRYHFKNFYYEEKSLHLEHVAKALEKTVVEALKEKGPNSQERLEAYLMQQSIQSGQRITVLKNDGSVIFDSNKDPALMDDPTTSEEVIDALSGKMGKSRRLSHNLNEDSLYLAIPLKREDKIIGVLRHSFITHDLKPALWGYTINVFWGTLVLGILLTILLTLNSKSVSNSLNRIRIKAQDFALGNFKESIPNHPDDTSEISSLVKSLNEMASKLGHLFDKIQTQRSEREAIFSGMSEGVLSVYMDNNIFHWNESVCRFFDVPYSTEYKGVPLLEVFRNSHIFNFVEQVKKQNFFIEDEIELPNGNVLQVHGSILKRVNGEDLGVLMVFNDITRMRKLESHRKDFVANVSHELRTPLTSIQGYVETLLEGNVDSPEMRDRFLFTIKRNAERLHQITEDLLALSELDMEQDGNKVRFELTELGPILKGAIVSCEPKARRKQIELEMVAQKDLYTPANSRLIEQALVNLIDNAIKYSGEGTHVTVTLAMDKEEKNIILQVADQGPGISEEHLERLFERFYSANKDRSRELGGSGLGLSIVKNIALAHGGYVNVESKKGKGSLFSIVLPKIEDQNPEETH